jgi:UDP-N-acetylmuramyl-tripeptide synthetase
MKLATPRGELELETPLVGRYNVENVMAVVAVAEVLALDREAVRRAVARREPVRGRLEPVDAGQRVPIFVDFAHTDGGLQAALGSLRELGPEKIAVVFGCGGDRDPGKRRLMGRVAGELADLPIVTSDNPRSEDPLAIITDVEEGLKESGNRKYKVIPDRREAIRRAVSITTSREGWCLLIAGKGHEEIQILGERTLPFSDREEVLRALEESLGTATNR